MCQDNFNLRFIVNEIIKMSFSHVIPNLPPEAPLGATTRSDSRDWESILDSRFCGNDKTGVLHYFMSTYPPERLPAPIPSPASCFRKKAQGLGMGAGKHSGG